ncbi:MAG: ABC transporter ATP-binding protein [Acidimicrobiales bacterium]
MAGTGTAHLRDGDVVLSVEDLVVEYPAAGGQKVHAVSGVSFDVLRGETLGLVGESGCGKSTTGRAVVQLQPATSGSVKLEGQELTTLHGEEMRRHRTRLQMIFQDAIAALNPRRKVRDIVAEAIDIWGADPARSTEERIDKILLDVGLDPDVVGDRMPGEFSGGQCQRINIARALMLDPAVLVCDEPVSALDVSVQAQILNLLQDMKARYGLTMLFISHDLAVVKNVSDRIIVMYLGKICEIADSEALYESPAHPYTRVLLDSIPQPDPTRLLPDTAIVGEPPSPLDPPSGCRFRTRCDRASDLCAREEPEIRALGGGRFVACHHPAEVPVAVGGAGSVTG